MSAYQLLHDRFKRIGALSGAQSMLYWDMATMMPPGGAQARGEQLAALQLVQHELLVAPEVEDLLAQAAAEVTGEATDGDLDRWRVANLREMRRLHVEATAVPARLVEALAKACRRCE